LKSAASHFFRNFQVIPSKALPVSTATSSIPKSTNLPSMISLDIDDPDHVDALTPCQSMVNITGDNGLVSTEVLLSSPDGLPSL